MMEPNNPNDPLLPNVGEQKLSSVTVPKLDISGIT